MTVFDPSRPLDDQSCCDAQHRCHAMAWYCVAADLKGGPMKRRAFITLLSGTAVWPLAVGAQQAAMPVIGLLNGGTSEADAFRVSGFREGLSETGYAEGHNVKFEYRWADGQYERLPQMDAELVNEPV